MAKAYVEGYEPYIRAWMLLNGENLVLQEQGKSVYLEGGYATGQVFRKMRHTLSQLKNDNPDATWAIEVYRDNKHSPWKPFGKQIKL